MADGGTRVSSIRTCARCLRKLKGGSSKKPDVRLSDLIGRIRGHTDATSSAPPGIDKFELSPGKRGNRKLTHHYAWLRDYTCTNLPSRAPVFVAGDALEAVGFIAGGYLAFAKADNGEAFGRAQA
jgi:hypothetical protein